MYIEVAHLNVASAGTVIAALKDVFGRHGVPETVVSDNGPQYSSDLFKDFSRDYGFSHVTSSPGYPQANGEAERAVATVKNLWKGGEDKLQALLAYRATPLECGYSPSQLLMGRQLRTNVPQLPVLLQPSWPKMARFRMRERKAKGKQRQNYNVRHRLRPLQPCVPGQKIWLPSAKKGGTVIRCADTPRSYIINTEDGQIRRNRADMRTVGNTQMQLRSTTSADNTEKDSSDKHTHKSKDSNTNNTNTFYVTASGRVSRPPAGLDL
uniref:Integrase catalytic domain-containing protein n=1 Tax=Oryzias melastigma TaxID=30732 RepID=A0A3B3CMJ2_ORYME